MNITLGEGQIQIKELFVMESFFRPLLKWPWLWLKLICYFKLRLPLLEIIVNLNCSHRNPYWTLLFPGSGVTLALFEFWFHSYKKLFSLSLERLKSLKSLLVITKIIYHDFLICNKIIKHVWFSFLMEPLEKTKKSIINDSGSTTNQTVSTDNLGWNLWRHEPHQGQYLALPNK